MSDIKRLIFMGSPAFAVPSLKALVAAGHSIAVVYTQPPRPAGRGNKLQKTAVHEAAEAMGLPVLHPEKLKAEALEALLATPADLICVVGFGMLLPRAVVESRLCLNVHPSALPRWRGATPVQSALMAGDTTTDVCIMQLEAGMDTGPVFSRTPVVIPPDMTCGELNDIVWELGAKRLCYVVDHVETLTPIPQQGEATLAPKVTPETRQLDWALPAATLHNRVRGLAPAPGAVGLLAGETVKILQTATLPAQPTAVPGTVLAAGATGIDVATGDGVLRILSLQRPGGRPLPAADVARGWKGLVA